MSLSSKPPACPACGGRLRRMGGGEGRPAGDERWLCDEMVRERFEERTKVAFDHLGEVWNVKYVLRNEENQRAIEREKSQIATLTAKLNADAEAKGEEPLQVQHNFDWSSARPGDFTVDRGMKTVYLVGPDGALRRCDNPGLRDSIIDKVRELLNSEKSK